MRQEHTPIGLAARHDFSSSHMVQQALNFIRGVTRYQTRFPKTHWEPVTSDQMVSVSPTWQLGHVGKGADVFAEPPYWNTSGGQKPVVARMKALSSSVFQLWWLCIWFWKWNLWKKKWVNFDCMSAIWTNTVTHRWKVARNLQLWWNCMCSKTYAYFLRWWFSKFFMFGDLKLGEIGIR